MDRNTIIAGVLSFLIIFTWMHYANKKQILDSNTNDNVNMQTSAINFLNNNDSEKVEESYKFSLENENQRFVLDKNGNFKNIFLKEKNGSFLDLTYNNSNYINIYPKIIYNKEYSSEKDFLILNGKMEDDVEVKMSINFSSTTKCLNNKLILQNTSNKTIRIENFSINLGKGINTDEDIPEKQKIANMSISYFTDNKVFNKKKKIKPGINFVQNSWIAISNHYFLISMIDRNNFFDKINISNNTIPSISYTKDIVLNPKETINIDFDTIFTDKNYNFLKSFNIQLEKNVSLGFFNFIGKIILFTLFFLQNITGNYGFAIIILTLIIQFILSPLNIKSILSMNALKSIQPKLNDIKERYKDDPNKMNLEIMMLYKKEGVNPFGGCLPMIIQIPVFFALFNVIRNSAELRYSPFILWIKDLSRPDTISKFNNFSINILPILMCITMFFSQKVNMTNNSNLSQEEQSMNKTLYFMPIMFLFIFWNFPSGLVLYWLVSNVFNICLNVYMKKFVKIK